MPHIIEKTAYNIDELDSSAKSRAMDYMRGLIESDDYSDFIIEDAWQIAEMLGVTIDKARHHSGPAIYWSGFCSQGDGASFTGAYAYRRGALAAIKAHAPRDTDLHDIARALQKAQKPHFYKILARISLGRLSNHYSHENTVDIDCEHDDADRDIEDSAELIQTALRDFMRWIYRQLEKEYEYQTSDEQITEMIKANDYSFDERGALI